MEPWTSALTTREVPQLAFLDPREQVVKRHTALVLVLDQALTQRAVLGKVARVALVGEDAELITSGRNAGQAEDLDRIGGAGAVHGLALGVHQRADTAVARACNDGIANVQRAATYQHGGHRSAALVELGLDDDARRERVGVGGEFQHVGLEQHHLEQLIDADALLGGHVLEDRRAAPLLRHDLMLGEHLLDLLGVGILLVDLVDRDDDRNSCGLGVVDSLHGLWHDAVVGCHHKDDDVGDVGTAGTHGGECLVTRRVDERDEAAVLLDHRGTDMLGDATGFRGGHARLTDRVKERRLAMVDVTHDGDDRRTRLEVGGVVDEREPGLLLRSDDLHLDLEVLGEDLHRVAAQRLIDRMRVAEHEQTFTTSPGATSRASAN